MKSASSKGFGGASEIGLVYLGTCDDADFR
jgi:hypothetical protein